MNPIFEAMSAMQKCIRRGMEEEAYFFALKLEEFNPTMLWNRLQIIVSEDIGTGNPTLPITFNILREWYFKNLQKGKAGDLELTHIILLMCRSKKNRDAPHLMIVAELKLKHENYEIAIPDFAFDRHTVQGKKMGRGWDHFFKESQKLENHEKSDNSDKWEAECKRLLETYKPTGDFVSASARTQKVLQSYQKVKDHAKNKQESLIDYFGDGND